MAPPPISSPSPIGAPALADSKPAPSNVMVTVPKKADEAPGLIARIVAFFKGLFGGKK